VKFGFNPSKLEKQPFFGNNFKIQGGAKRRPSLPSLPTPMAATTKLILQPALRIVVTLLWNMNPSNYEPFELWTIRSHTDSLKHFALFGEIRVASWKHSKCLFSPGISPAVRLSSSDLFPFDLFTQRPIDGCGKSTANHQNKVANNSQYLWNP